MGTQEFNVVYFYWLLAPDFAYDARYWIWMAGSVERGAWIVDVDTLEGGGEAVRVAFAALFTVSNDIEAGAFLVADSEKRCIVLRFFQKFRSNAPQLPRPNAWWEARGKLFTIDQPIRLGVRAHK
jgi:hypothetical protein